MFGVSVSIYMIKDNHQQQKYALIHIYIYKYFKHTCPWKSRHGAGPPRVCWTSLLSLSLFLVVVFKSLSFFLHSSTERWHGPCALTLNYQRCKNWSLHMFYLGCSYYFIHTGFIIFVPYSQISLVHVCFEKEKKHIFIEIGWLEWSFKCCMILLVIRFVIIRAFSVPKPAPFPIFDISCCWLGSEELL